MFNKQKNTPMELFGKTNRIVEGTRIKGDISSIADFRLDGELIGNFTSQGKLVIGPTGKVIGNITCKNLDIEGTYEGKLDIAELLTVKAKAKITGEASVGKLAVEPGAEFMATCQMKGSVKKLSNHENDKSTPEEKAI